MVNVLRSAPASEAVKAMGAQEKKLFLHYCRTILLAVAALAMLAFGFFVVFDIEDESIVHVDINAQWKEIWEPIGAKPNLRKYLQDMDIWDNWALTLESYFDNNTASRPTLVDYYKSSKKRKVLHLPVPMARALHWWKRRVHSRIAEWRPIKHVAERVRISFKTLLTPVRELRGLHNAFKEWLANVKNVSEGAGELGSFIQKCKDVHERPKVKVFLKFFIRVIMPAAAATRLLLPLLL